MKNKNFKLLLLGILFITEINGQVKTKTFVEGVPFKLLPAKELGGKEYRVPIPFEFSKLKKQAKVDDNVGGINKFALPILVNIDLLKEASFKVSNGITLYSLMIKAETALNISIQFNKFQLSENSILSIYTTNEITDSITTKENNKNKIWATRVYQGNTLRLVLKIPTSEIKQSLLIISTIYLGYKNYGLSSEFGSPGASNSCQPNVACPAGLSWENERNAVALINANGGWCSGALVMNTCSTNIPYLLTARHCVVQGGDISSWVFQFLYYSTDCNTNIGYREDIQINGCVLRAMSSVSDFALVELNQLPPVNSGIRYAGWRNNVVFTNKTTILHHPKGDVMKISSADGLPQPAVFNDAQCWRLDLNLGGTQGGSSGAPYFNHEHKIIGQHFGIYAINESNPCHPEKFGGRFDQSWTGEGTNGTRLSNWLDPTNTGANVTTTTNISALSYPIGSLSISGDNTVCTTSNPYTIPNLPAGATVSWTAIPSGLVTINSPSATQTTLTNNNSGVITLTATISSVCGGQLQKVIPIGLPTPAITSQKVSAPGEPTEYLFTATFIPGAIYNWYVNGLLITGEIYNTLQYYFPCNVTKTIKCSITNPCGTSAFSNSISKTGGCDRLNAFKISPNPASDIVIVSLADNKNKTSLEQKEITYFTEIKIFDAQGNLKKHQKFNQSKQATVNLTGLTTGVYIVEITDGDYIERHQIVIQQ